MSVHLIGGGRDLDLAPVVYGDFVRAAAQRAATGGRPRPTIGVLIVAEPEELVAGVDWFRQAIARCGSASVVGAAADENAAGPLRLDDGAVVDDDWFARLDGLLVGGGLTPAYHRVVQPRARAIRDAVTDGLPYAGFSAGAMIAAARALIGGWRLSGVAVTNSDNAEDLDQVTVVDGLGLVSSTVEVHTAQWGTLSRLVAAAAAGDIDQGLAVDENTVVILDVGTDSLEPYGVRVAGAGQAWFVTPDAGAVVVLRRPAD